MRKLTLILAVLLCVANILTAQETKGKPTIVVIPFDAKNIEQSDAEVLFEVFTNEIAGTGKFKVVDRTKVNEIKKQHEFQNSDWSNDEKVAKLGNALNANIVVTGQLMPFKDKIVVSFRMLDVNTMEIVTSATARVSDTSEFFDKIPEIVKKLMGEIKSISTTSNITTSKTESSSVSTNVSTSKNTTTYNIGDDGPGGGIIFYHSEVGFDVYEPDGSVRKCHYLEVSKLNLGNISWCTQKDFWYLLKDSNNFCCDIATYVGLGYGKENTYKIIKSTHRSGTITKKNCAALACYSYSTATTKAGDWFLPSKDELNLLYENLRNVVLIGCTGSEPWLWSSSTNSGVWSQKFIDGKTNDFSKYFKFNVRAVRAF